MNKADIHVLRARGFGGRVTRWGVQCSCGWKSPGVASTKDAAVKVAASHGEQMHLRNARIIAPRKG